MSFNEFAYSLSEKDETSVLDGVAPLPPWQIEAALPSQHLDGYFIQKIDVEVARLIDEHKEIWLKVYLFASKPENVNQITFLVYTTETKEWKNISSNIGDTGIFIKNLFIASDGSVWGQTTWNLPFQNSEIERIPVLGKFNEHTQQFEFVPGVFEIAIEQVEGYRDRPEIVLDGQDIFWIFVQNDGLYRYDPINEDVEKQVHLPDFSVDQVALSPDGSIYFENYSDQIYSQESFFRLSDETLFQFKPETKEILSLKVPDEPWPVFSGLLVDRTGKLWMGAIGYRDDEDTWNLIHPNTEEYFKYAGDPYRAPPHLLLESSNGILWYERFLDSDLKAEGTAWFDPKSGDGCLFTNFAAEVVEDQEGNLWMTANNKLYKLDLDP